MAAPAGNPMDKLLWRIAELGSRYSDPRWSEQRAETWTAMQQAVARAGADVAAMARAVEDAQDRMRNAEAKLGAVHREHERYAARAQALTRSLREAKEEAARALSRLARTEHERDEARTALEAVQREGDELREELVAAQHEQDELRAAVNAAERERDEARAALGPVEVERDEARAALGAVEVERDGARAATAAAIRERDELAEALAAAEPAAAEPAAGAGEAGGPVTVPVRINGWDQRRAPQAHVPGWWKANAPAPPVAEPVPDGNGNGAGTVAPEAVAADEQVPTIDLTTPVTYLSVRATPGQLLPHDLGEILVRGARVVRREGRLAAVIAVDREADEWRRPDTDSGEEQAQRLRDAGLRFEFIDEALAS